MKSDVAPTAPTLAEPWSLDAIPQDCQHCAAVFWVKYEGKTQRPDCPSCGKPTRLGGADNRPWNWYVHLVATMRRATLDNVKNLVDGLQ